MRVSRGGVRIFRWVGLSSWNLFFDRAQNIFGRAQPDLGASTKGEDSYHDAFRSCLTLSGRMVPNGHILRLRYKKNSFRLLLNIILLS